MAKLPKLRFFLQTNPAKTRASQHVHHFHASLNKQKGENPADYHTERSESRSFSTAHQGMFRKPSCCYHQHMRDSKCGQSWHSFWISQKLQQDDADLDRNAFLSLLRACAAMKDVDLARQIRAKLFERGLGRDPLLGTMLISMFCRCGSLAEAFEVFESLPDRNVVSWNALLTGYVENKHQEDAFSHYSQMHSSGISPNVITFTCILKACAAVGSMERGWQLHAEIVKRGFEGDHLLSNTLIDMFAKCGSLLEAQAVFDKLSVQDVVSWNALISGLAKHGFSHEALNHFKEMQRQGLASDAVTVICTLKACGSIPDLKTGREIRAIITKHGLDRDLTVASALINMFGKCNSLTEAREIFDRMPVRNVIGWNALITSYVTHGHSEEALYLFDCMQFEGVLPDSITYTFSLKACGSLGALRRGQQMRAEVVERGFERDPCVGSSIVDMLVKCGSLVDARDMLDSLHDHSTFSSSAMIAGYVEHGFEKEALECFDLMQSKGLSPDAVTFVSILKACSSLGDVARGREMRSQIAKRGLENNPFIGSATVDMFAKCGSLAEAREVFDMLPFRNVISWSALIAGYVDHGLGNEALNCFELMQMEGWSPDPVTYVSVLKACGSIRSIERGCKLRIEIAERGLDLDAFIGTALVVMFSKCSELNYAQEVFNKLPVRDVVAWNAMIEGYVEEGFNEEALSCFEEMQLEGIQPDLVVCVCSLKACGSIGAIERGWMIHAEAVKKGMEGDCTVGNTLIDMFGRFGMLAEAQEVFDRLSNQDAISWSLLIAMYTENEFAKKAIECFEQMQLEGISPHAETYVSVLRACTRMLWIEKGREIRAEMAQKGLERDIFVGNSLIDMFSKCGSIREAQEVFEKLPTRDVVSWNALITGYTDQGCGREALKLFDDMQHQGVSPDAITLVGCIKACGIVGALVRGREIWYETARKGLDEDVYVGSILVDMFGKCHALKEAQEIFNRLPVVGVATWSALIGMYVEHELGEVAISCFQSMQCEGFSPDIVTYICSLKACCSTGNVQIGLHIHMQLVIHGFEKDNVVASTLIDMYGICCSIVDAQSVFDRLLVQDAASWTAMIKVYSINNDIKMAMQFFENMLEQGIHSDAVTYKCLLAACSRASLVLKGHEYFKKMSEHKILPTTEHYTFLVNLFACSGLIHEAEKFIDLVQFCLPKETWMALLSACKVYGDMHLGLKCFQHIAQLDRGEASAYALMADIYASAGRWADAHRIEELRVLVGARKKPASASIESQHVLYEFEVGSSQTEEIMGTLESIILRMKGDGYVPTSNLILKHVACSRYTIND